MQTLHKTTWIRTDVKGERARGRPLGGMCVPEYCTCERRRSRCWTRPPKVRRKSGDELSLVAGPTDDDDDAEKV